MPMSSRPIVSMPSRVRDAVEKLMCVRGSLALYSMATRIAWSISATARTPSSASRHSSG